MEKCAQSIFQLPSELGRTWNLDSISTSPLCFAVLRSRVRCRLRSLADFSGVFDDSQL